MSGSTLVLAYPGCIGFEVMLAAELVHPRFPVLVATPDGAPFANSNGMRVSADTDYASIDPDAFACVLVPGGDPGAIMDDTDVDRVLGTAVGRGALVGGICAGVLVLAKAGVLRGRRATHNYTAAMAPRAVVVATAPFWEGIEYIDAPVAVDGSVVTAQPQAYVEFAVTVARLLGACDDERAEGLRRYYGGGR